jgi:hypothetical protein
MTNMESESVEVHAPSLAREIFAGIAGAGIAVCARQTPPVR